LNLAKGILEVGGYEVDVASGGQEEVDTARSNSYDLILKDVQMPAMDGFDATGAIREWQKSRALDRTQIIAVTAHAPVGYREKCLGNEMDYYITKPLIKELLLDMVEKWLRVSGAKKSDSPGVDIGA
jgi:CheY-like chemotaxis protein